MNASPFWRFLQLTKPQRWRILVGIALILTATLLMLPAPWILKLIIDRALPHKDMRLLMELLVAFTGLFILRAWLTLVRNRILQFAAMRIVCDLRIRLFAHQRCKIDAKPRQRFARHVAQTKVDGGIFQQAANQKLHRQIVNPLGAGFPGAPGGGKPRLYDSVA